jgi:alkaline phosphatase D
MELTGLPAGQQILFEVQFEDARDARAISEPAPGSFSTVGGQPGDVVFLWSGDTAGQGWGINPEWGGMKSYQSMLSRDASFFIHSGDTIYADQPIVKEVRLPDGRVWRNIVTEEKSKVAESLNEFRGNYRYNLLDEHVRRFNAATPQIWQWDDHEVLNNWSPSKDLTADARYTEKNIATLASRARRAFLEYAPMRLSPSAAPRIYRHIPYGPLLDVFVIDMRSYRGPNTFNGQSKPGPETVYLGRPQIDWLLGGLKRSKAVWKAIASDMPLGLVVTDGRDPEGRTRFENSANGDGPPLGRELEIARLLESIKRSGVRNVVWFTADTHYTAAHFYDPSKARFTSFDPFWEFVSGPLHAGTFGPNQTDDTFGIQVKFQKAPPVGQSNLAPWDGLQFYGEVRIDARRQDMTVTLRDLAGTALYTQSIEAASGRDTP